MLGVGLRPEVLGGVVTAKVAADEMVNLASVGHRLSFRAGTRLEGTYSLALGSSVTGQGVILHRRSDMSCIFPPFGRTYCGFAVYPYCALGDDWIGQEGGAVLLVVGLLGGQDPGAGDNHSAS